MTTPHIASTREGTVARLWLDRPERRNALAPETLLELATVCRGLAEDEDLRVVVLEGRGPSFSVGFDLQAMSALFFEGGGLPGDEDLRAVARAGAGAVEALCALPATTVASVHGHVVGGGFLLAAACDFRVCAEGTRFVLPEIDLGLPLAWAGIPLLHQKLGLERARDLLLTGRSCGPEELVAAGFLNSLVAAGHRAEKTEELVANLAAKPAWALRELTRALRPDLTRDEEAELAAFVSAIRHPRFLENAMAYVQKIGRRD